MFYSEQSLHPRNPPSSPPNARNIPVFSLAYPLLKKPSKPLFNRRTILLPPKCSPRLAQPARAPHPPTYQLRHDTRHFQATHQRTRRPAPRRGAFPTALGFQHDVHMCWDGENGGSVGGVTWECWTGDHGDLERGRGDREYH